ncbi:MAG: hypothetical protein ACHREM_24040 [Polyangiales bacterium]
MPLPLAPFIAALVGLALALVGRDEARRTGAHVTSLRGFAIVTLVSVTLIAPATGYFVSFYPDWSYAYLVSATTIPSAIDLLLVLAIAAVTVAAYVGTVGALRRQSAYLLTRWAIGLLVALVVIGMLLAPRLLVLTTTEAYRAGGDKPSIGGSALGVSVLWIDACAAAGLAWAARQLRLSARA